MGESYNKLDRRVKTVEEAVLLLKKLVLRADERVDGVVERMNGFEAALTNLTVELEALADARIHTEESMFRLADAQAHTDQRLDALINIARESLNRH